MSSSSSPLNIPYLPDDLVLNCLARISRLYYPSLSLVSKRFRSLLTSLELYETRTRLGSTESCLYVCLRFPPDSNSTRWFTLCRRKIQIGNFIPNPKHNPTWYTLSPNRRLFIPCDNKLNENVLVSIPPRNSPLGLIAVGYKIYKIGGCIDGEASSKVFFIDCRSHTWHEAPSMQMARRRPLAVVLDGKIYVVEGDGKFDSSNLMEFFDPKTKKWEDVPNPSAEILGTYVDKILAIKGNVFLLGDKDIMVYKLENIWDKVEWEKHLRCYSCVIDNVLYYSDYLPSGKIKWYDSEGSTWRVLKGLEKMPNVLLDSRFKLVNNGGKIAVFWEEDLGKSNNKMIWCAEISLQRRNKEEIFGKVEWCNGVLIVPKSCCYEQLIAATV